MVELRIRTRIPADELAEKVGKMLTPDDFNVLLTGPTRVTGPDGRPLAVYLPRALSADVCDAAYPDLHRLKQKVTKNRGTAGGAPMRKRGETNTAMPISSAVIGMMDRSRRYPYCRTTAFNAAEADRFENIRPVLAELGELWREWAPVDRVRNQLEQVEATDPAWIIDGTPFTTITVNNTYPTGVHQDAGDLATGFSCLAVLRRGQYAGGQLCFPEFRVAVDMGNLDVILFDAHQWHGNIPLQLVSDDAERISLVCYYRERMRDCGTATQEAEVEASYKEARNRSRIA